MPSIAKRITFGFYTLTILMVVMAICTVSDWYFLIVDIQQKNMVAVFVESVAEMRRQEKNFFLYGKRQDLNLALRHNQDLLHRLADSSPFSTANCADRNAFLRTGMNRYYILVRELINHSQPTATPLQNEIRAVGQRISNLTHELAQCERTVLTQLITQISNWLLLMVLCIGVVGGILGLSIARSITRPLQQLEQDLSSIAAGRFSSLIPPSQDLEFISLAAAFNRMLKELDDRQRHIRQAEKLASLGTLVSGVAHELNNPLSNISTSCQLALEEIAEATHSQMDIWLQQIAEQTARAKHIVLALSNYARQRPLTIETLDLNSLLDSTILLIRKQLGKGVTLHRQITAPTKILADYQRLQQIFINLLKNSVDAGGPQVVITLTAQLVNQPFTVNDLDKAVIVGISTSDKAVLRSCGPYVVITIADNGPGIPANVLQHIFEPFFTTRAIGTGMGLGLYIVQELIQEMGGSISVESTLGQGASFAIILPTISTTMVDVA